MSFKTKFARQFLELGFMIQSIYWYTIQRVLRLKNINLVIEVTCKLLVIEVTCKLSYRGNLSKESPLSKFLQNKTKSTHFCRSACSFSSGSIFSITFEYWTFALHHAASGAAAWDALLAFCKNKID